VGPDVQCRYSVKHLSCLLKDIQERLQAHGKKYVIFIDYKKACDTVNRRKLIAKLESLIGFSDMTNLIANMSGGSIKEKGTQAIRNLTGV
jgi:Reverse transcriptase (RNA-dependent DNA polymerase).